MQNPILCQTRQRDVPCLVLLPKPSHFPCQQRPQLTPPLAAESALRTIRQLLGDSSRFQLQVSLKLPLNDTLNRSLDDGALLHTGNRRHSTCDMQHYVPEPSTKTSWGMYSAGTRFISSTYGSTCHSHQLLGNQH